MFDYIKGILTNKNSNNKGFFATIETQNGIGYLLEVTSTDFSKISLSDEIIKIYTVLIHKEDKMALCGFTKREDRDIFNILTSVSGVGSKMALTLLDNFPSAELIGFVIDGNYKELTRAKGVGPKLAQKIILELKDKLMNYKAAEPIKIPKTTVQNAKAIEDAQLVLVSLGYEKDEIEQAMSKAVILISDNSSAEEILRETLKILSC